MLRYQRAAVGAAAAITFMPMLRHMPLTLTMASRFRLPFLPRHCRYYGVAAMPRHAVLSSAAPAAIRYALHTHTPPSSFSDYAALLPPSPRCRYDAAGFFRCHYFLMRRRQILRRAMIKMPLLIARLCRHWRSEIQAISCYFAACASHCRRAPSR